MKKRLKQYLAAALAVAMASTTFTISAFGLTPELNIASDAYVVIDAASGQVLIEKNMNKRKAPASITKILTLALALENGGIMDDKITVSKAAVTAMEPGSTHIALVDGEQITFRDAVMGTQLISANDAANVVAEYISGSIPSFVAHMNAKVNELGLSGSHFANPNGLDAKEHYVTAYDMAQITRYALTVPGFREIFGATEYQMPPTNIKARNWKFLAQNAIMFPANKEYYDGITGSKLGYTYDANHTLVASARRGNMELIVVALDSKGGSPKYNDAKLLLDYCFERYEMITISGRELRTGDVPVASIENPSATVSIASNTDHTFAVPLGTAKSSLEIRYDVPEVYKSERNIAPSFTVCNKDGQVLYTAPLSYTVTPIDRLAQAPGSPVPKPRTDYFGDMMLVAFKCLLVALGVFMMLFFICRCVIMLRYAINRQKAYKKKLAMVKRRELALQRNAAEIKRLEQELGIEIRMTRSQTPSGVPNNVTRIYPNRVQTDTRSAGQGK